ncbi:outer membrane protein [Novosphingobium bradum]|uniref:Outer membrane protein n=1 Tax=Novosphingobium bradum TaxID=1737444 RepID=A0ABV7IVL6_9SPHN
MKKYFAILAATPVAFGAQAALAAPLAGPYIGVQGNHDAYEVKAQGLNISGTSVSADGISGNGKGASIYAGYDLPLAPSAFVGLEAGFDYSGAGISLSAANGGNTVGTSIKARETYSIAARLGVVVGGSTGLYAKAGYANTRFKASAQQNGVTQFADSRHHGAFVYGGGIETGLVQNVSVRAEFTVSDYGSAGLDQDFGVTGIKVSNSKTSVGISYRF